MGRAGNLLRGSASIRAFSNSVSGVRQRQREHAPQTVFVFNEQDIRHDEKQNPESRSQNPEVRIQESGDRRKENLLQAVAAFSILTSDFRLVAFAANGS
jgi:hypothetical protein